MEKTKLGLNPGVIGALAFIACLFGGYTVAILAVGYILLCETDGWLRRTGVKALVLLILFSLLSFVIALIPDLFGILCNLLYVFNVSFYPEFVYDMENFLLSIVSLAKYIVFLVFAFMALKKKTIVIAPLETLISKFMA